MMAEPCRICLSIAGKTERMSIFVQLLDKLVIDIIKECSSIQILENDNLPKYICFECANTLHSLYKFRNLIIQSDIRLKQGCVTPNKSSESDPQSIAQNTHSNENLSLENNPDKHKSGETVTKYNEEELSEEKLKDFKDDIVIKKEEDIDQVLLESVHIKVEENVSPKQFLSQAKKTKCMAKRRKQGPCVNNADKHKSSEMVIKYNKGLSEDNPLKDFKDDIVIKKEKDEGGGRREVDIKVEESPKQFLNQAVKTIRVAKRRKRGPYVCELCGKVLGAPGTLKLHLMIHAGHRPFPCEFCGKGFINNYALLTHRRTHTGDKPFTCDQCGKKFTALSGLICHRAVHATGEKPFRCKTCNAGFYVSRRLKEHERYHTGVRPFMCEICEKRYTSKAFLLRHMKNSHASQDAKIPCPTCGKTFNNQTNLRHHIRRHTGLKPFKCDECDHKFTDKGSLKRHKVIHSGAKPYKCKVCGKSFSQSSILSRHMLIHSGEKRFSCTLCSMDFTYKHHLQGHMRKHHKEETIESTNACENMQTDINDD